MFKSNIQLKYSFVFFFVIMWLAVFNQSAMARSAVCSCYGAANDSSFKWHHMGFWLNAASAYWEADLQLQNWTNHSYGNKGTGKWGGNSPQINMKNCTNNCKTMCSTLNSKPLTNINAITQWRCYNSNQSRTVIGSVP